MPKDIEAIYTDMHSANPKAVSLAAMKLLNDLQDLPEEIQLASAGVILLIVSRRYNIAPSTILNCVDNIMRSSKRYDDATFRAIADYFKNELSD